MATALAKSQSHASHAEVPPYIRWYNQHWALLAAMPLDLSDVVSTAARAWPEMSPTARRAFVRDLNKVAPKFGTLLAKVMP